MSNEEKIQSIKRITPVGDIHITCISIIGVCIWILGLGIAIEMLSIYLTGTQLMESPFTDRGSRIEFIGFLLMILLLIGCFFLLGNWFVRRSKMRSSVQQTYLEGHSSTKGTIVDIQKRPGDMDSPDQFFISVQFKTESGSYTLTSEVKRRVYKNATKGRSIGVRYSESDPRIALFEGEY